VVGVTVRKRKFPIAFGADVGAVDMPIAIRAARQNKAIDSKGEGAIGAQFAFAGATV
jgi:hypothetical protein